MLKFSSISKFVVAYQSLKASFYLPSQFKKAIKKASRQYYSQNQLLQDNHKPQICKLMFEKFEDKLSLIRWGEVSDKDFGGSSKADLFYSLPDQCITIKGSIDPENRDKLQTIPFVGMIQRNPFSFKTGIFNSLRVCLQGDGESVRVQIKFFSPMMGDRLAIATILTKSNQWATYELPFRNFQIKGFEVTNRMDEYDKQKQTVSQVLDDELPNPDDFQIDAISFRLPDSERKSRIINFKSIQLVRTLKGTKNYYWTYKKPYFYTVKPQVQEDSSYQEQLDLGHFNLSFNKKQ